MQSYPKKLQDTLVFVLLILAGAGLATMLVKVWQLPVKTTSEAQFISYELPDGTYCVAIKESDHLALACDFDATQRTPINPKPQEHRL